MSTSGTALVYRAINDVTAALAKTGIAKDRKNDQQGYRFRGIDECYNALAPLLAQHKLAILPRYTERTCVERQTRNGSPLFYVTVRGEFDFVSAEDGSKHTVVLYGEAMDSGDKASSKAASAAYKYAVMQAFCIPVVGETHDADATTHDVAPESPPPSPAPAPGRVVGSYTPAKRLAELAKEYTGKYGKTALVRFAEWHTGKGHSKDMTPAEVSDLIAALDVELHGDGDPEAAGVGQ